MIIINDTMNSKINFQEHKIKDQDEYPALW